MTIYSRCITTVVLAVDPKRRDKRPPEALVRGVGYRHRLYFLTLHLYITSTKQELWGPHDAGSVSSVLALG